MNKWKKSEKLNKISDKIRGTQDIFIDTTPISEAGEQNILLLSLIGFICSFSGYMGFCTGFKIGVSTILVMAVSLVFSFVTQFLLANQSRTKIGLPAMAVAIIGFIAVTSVFIINGFTLIINKLIDYVNVHKAEAHLKYVVTHKTEKTDIFLATIVICAVYTIIFQIVLKYKRIFLCALLLLGASMTNMYFNGEDSLLWVSMTLICTFLVFYISNIRIPKMKKNLTVSGGLLFGLAAVTAVFVLLANYNGIRSVEDLKDEIIYHTGNIIYGKSDYPQGQFKRFHQVPAGTEKNRLTISMTNPVPMHLRGYVGCQYTEKGWKENDEEIYGGDNRGMLEWFLEQGYYPLIQPAYYMGYSRNDGRDIDFDKVGNSSIHVVNHSASKKYEYVPENLLDMSGLITPKQDVNFMEQDIFSEKEYWYDILYFTEDDYLKFPKQQWFEEGGTIANQKQFVQAEKYYHGFVSKYYLEVPDAEKEILRQNIPSCSNNVSDAISTVRRYLKNRITYSENCSQYNPDKNYLSQILLEDRKGYSVHFATIATLMFRYYGVPARYVEGYLSLNEEEKETVILSDKDAHAWVEVYIKGIGFVPIEVTPGYYQEEEVGGDVIHKKQDQKNLGGGGGSENDEDDDDGDARQLTWKMVFKSLAILLAICLVLFIIVLIIRRVLVLKKREKQLQSEDKYGVVATASKVIEDAYVFEKKDIRKEVPREIKTILERVKFSSHMLSTEDMNRVCDCMNQTIEEIFKRQSWIKKIKMMFWNCLK